MKTACRRCVAAVAFLLSISAQEPCGASAGDDAFIKQLLERVQRNNELAQTIRSDYRVQYDVIGNGEVSPVLRATGLIVYKKPDRVRLEVHKLEDAGGSTTFRDITGNEVDVYLYRRNTEEGFDLVSGKTTKPRASLDSEMRMYFNRLTSLRLAYQFHDVTLVGRSTRGGVDVAVLKFIPRLNAGDKAITTKEITLTIDIPRAVIIKSEELVADENLQGETSDDLPEVALYTYQLVAGAFVLTRREAIWDDVYSYGSDGPDPARFRTALLQRHVVEEFTNVRINEAVSDQEFRAP